VLQFLDKSSELGLIADAFRLGFVLCQGLTPSFFLPMRGIFQEPAERQAQSIAKAMRREC